MHKVERNKAPLKLIEKDKAWKEKLKIDSNLKLDWEAFSKTSLKKEIILNLEDMYKGCCSYCESKINITSYPEIEHFKPKSLYPELCFDYSNLHYSCKRCNLAKGSNYNSDMINPSDDNPEEYIKYIGELAVSINDNKRGTVMIESLKLNDRADLRDERIKYLNEFSRNYELLITTIEELLSRGADDLNLVRPFIISFIENVNIKSGHGESYCTMIRQNFLDKADMLKSFL